jgi:hypothetical protein
MSATKFQSINKCLLKSERAIRAHLMAYVQHQQRWAVSVYAQQHALHPFSLAFEQTAHVCDSHHGFGADRSNASWGCHFVHVSVLLLRMLFMVPASVDAINLRVADHRSVEGDSCNLAANGCTSLQKVTTYLNATRSVTHLNFT